MLIIIINLLDCPGNYQYEKQPPTNFTHCNPVKTVLQLTCTALVPSDSTTVTVDWYWNKNISECGRYIIEEQGRFTTYTSRRFYLTNVDRITTDLTIESPQTNTGYYWCQVNDPSYNGVFTSSNKAPVFDTGTMTICSKQYVIMTTCAITSNINTPNFLMCFILTQTVSPSMYNNMLTSSYSETAMSISNIKSMSSTVTITVTTVSGTTSKKILESVTNLNSTKADHLLDSTNTEMYTTTSLITTSIILTATSTSDNKIVADTSLNHINSTITDHDSTGSEMYTTTSLITSSNLVKHTSDIFSSHQSSTITGHSSKLTLARYINCSNYSYDNDTIELISGLVLLSIIMFGLGGVLGGLLTVLWNKKRGGKGRAVVINLLLFNL